MKKTWMLALFTLLLLTATALAADCAICGGDLVCDTCGGLGYQMIFSSTTGQFEQAPCGSSCVNGDCPVCTESSTTSSAEPSIPYVAPVVGQGGLLVMPPHLYNSAIAPPVEMSGKSYYRYGYDFESSYRKLFIGYAEALMATGYYTMESYQYSDSHWYRMLKYIGPEPHTQKTDADYLAFEPVYAIVIGRVGSSISAYYCHDVVTTDYEQTTARFGYAKPSKNGTNSNSDSSTYSWSSGGSSSSSSNSTKKEISCPSCSNGKKDCTACGGSGGKYVYDSVPNYSGKGSKTVRTWQDCNKCRGSGKQDCYRCGGTGKIEY